MCQCICKTNAINIISNICNSVIPFCISCIEIYTGYAKVWFHPIQQRALQLEHDKSPPKHPARRNLNQQHTLYPTDIQTHDTNAHKRESFRQLLSVWCFDYVLYGDVESFCIILWVWRCACRPVCWLNNNLATHIIRDPTQWASAPHPRREILSYSYAKTLSQAKPRLDAQQFPNKLFAECLIFNLPKVDVAAGKRLVAAHNSNFAQQLTPYDMARPRTITSDLSDKFCTTLKPYAPQQATAIPTFGW